MIHSSRTTAELLSSHIPSILTGCEAGASRSSQELALCLLTSILHLLSSGRLATSTSYLTNLSQCMNRATKTSNPTSNALARGQGDGIQALRARTPMSALSRQMYRVTMLEPLRMDSHYFLPIEYHTHPQQQPYTLRPHCDDLCWRQRAEMDASRGSAGPTLILLSSHFPFWIPRDQARRLTTTRG